MKYLILLLAFPFSLIVSAQDTLSVELVDSPPQLKSEDFPKANEGADQNDLFLHSVYRSVRYPAYAHQYGVSMVVGVNYLVGVDGKTSIEETDIFTLEEATQLGLPTEEALTFNIRTTCRLRALGRTDKPVPPPAQSLIEERLAKANMMLAEVTTASILNLPRFIPGSHEGIPVVVRYTRFFSFNSDKTR